MGTFLLALTVLLSVFAPLGCATPKPANPCDSARMTREDVAKRRGIDPDAGWEIRCTTMDQVGQMLDQSGRLDRSVVWVVRWGTEMVVIDDASGDVRASGGCCGPRGIAPEPMPTQP